MNRTIGLRIALASSSVLAFFGCSQGAESGSQADSNLTARMTEQVADGARQACKFHRGAMPSETLGKELPLDVEIPIQNVVVLDPLFFPSGLRTAQRLVCKLRGVHPQSAGISKIDWRAA